MDVLAEDCLGQHVHVGAGLADESERGLTGDGRERAGGHFDDDVVEVCAFHGGGDDRPGAGCADAGGRGLVPAKRVGVGGEFDALGGEVDGDVGVAGGEYAAVFGGGDIFGRGADGEDGRAFPDGCGSGTGGGARLARKWTRYTPGAVNAQLMCWWASAGSCAVSVSYPVAALKPSEEAKAISGCPNDVVRYAAAWPGPSTPVVVRSICEARVAPMSVPLPHTRMPSHGVSRARSSTRGRMVAPFLAASSATETEREPVGRLESRARMRACSSSMR